MYMAYALIISIGLFSDSLCELLDAFGEHNVFCKISQSISGFFWG
jgi:hypothetical protein